jgi:hypothetical protein
MSCEFDIRYWISDIEPARLIACLLSSVGFAALQLGRELAAEDKQSAGR